MEQKMNGRRVLVRQALAGCALACAFGAQAAGTLIYCSEGSPEGFDPARYTAGTTFDAASQPLFNRLVEFERGGTRIEPALAEKWEVSADGLVYTFHLRRGVRFHTTEWFKPSRDFNADDVILRSIAWSTKTTPSTRRRPLPTSTRPTWACPTTSSSWRSPTRTRCASR
jgi:dipeptide transport system substrate-binding protein